MFAQRRMQTDQLLAGVVMLSILLVAGLSHVGPGRAEPEHPLHLGLDVGRTQVQVVTVLALFGPGARLQPHGRLAASRRSQVGAAVRLLDVVTEHLRPELRHPPDVLHVQRPLRDPARHP